jgi:hypothetical protein
MQVWRAVVGLAVAAAVGVFIGVQIAGPTAAESAMESARQQEARRDAAQIVELTSRARQTVTSVKPLLDGIAPGAAPAGEAQVGQWKRVIAEEVQWYSVTVSGTTATNVARGGLRAAIDQLAAAVDAYAAARTAPTPAQESLRQLAGRQRDLAIATWSVAATQLDQINVDAGNGHQHVYFPSSGGGAMTADNLPEGSR